MERPSFHHVWWEKANYKTKLERRWRGHKAFVVPLYKTIHVELHRDLSPPPKPKHEMMIQGLQVVEGLEIDHPQMILTMAEFFLDHEHPHAKRIGHHLVKQAGYIMEGLHDL
jgi:hypothetical protein